MPSAPSPTQIWNAGICAANAFPTTDRHSTPEEPFFAQVCPQSLIYVVTFRLNHSEMPVCYHHTWTIRLELFDWNYSECVHNEHIDTVEGMVAWIITRTLVELVSGGRHTSYLTPITKIWLWRVSRTGANIQIESSLRVSRWGEFTGCTIHQTMQ